MPNCSQATCEGNNVISLGPRPCPQVPEPTCANGYPAVKVTDEDGCCLHYQCQCEQGARRAAGQGLRFHTRKGFPAVGGGWVPRAGLPRPHSGLLRLLLDRTTWEGGGR